MDRAHAQMSVLPGSNTIEGERDVLSTRGFNDAQKVVGN